MSMTLTPAHRPRRPDWAIGPYCELLDVSRRGQSASARAALTSRTRSRLLRAISYGMNEETGGAAWGGGRCLTVTSRSSRPALPGSDAETGYGWLRLGVESWLSSHASTTTRPRRNRGIALPSAGRRGGAVRRADLSSVADRASSPPARPTAVRSRSSSDFIVSPATPSRPRPDDPRLDRHGPRRRVRDRRAGARRDR